MLSNYLFYKEIKFIARYYKGEYECLMENLPLLRSLSVASSEPGNAACFISYLPTNTLKFIIYTLDLT